MIKYKEVLKRATMINGRQLEILFERMSRPTIPKGELAKRCGVSRVTVWKDFKKLNKTSPELSHIFR